MDSKATIPRWTWAVSAVLGSGGFLAWGMDAFSAWMKSNEGKAEVPYLDTGYTVAEWLSRQSIPEIVVALLLLAGTLLLIGRSVSGFAVLAVGSAAAIVVHVIGYLIVRDQLELLDEKPEGMLFLPKLIVFPLITLAIAVVAPSITVWRSRRNLASRS